MRTVMKALGIENGRLTLGGADVCALAEEYGTPLYLLDEGTIRANCRELRAGLSESYAGDFSVTFASKALCFKGLYPILSEEKLCADVVSGGELHTALAGGFNPGDIYFHGNNKSREELEYALRAGVRRIVVDNVTELQTLAKLAAERGVVPEIAVRVKPGIDAHTHDFIQTGKIDSKFGVALETGEVREFAKLAAELKSVKLVGLHCHIGSQIFETEPFKLAASVMLTLSGELLRGFGTEITELNLGGGFGIQYLPAHDPVPLREAARMIGTSVTAAAKELGLPLPSLVIEPGRSVSGSAGLTVYTVGSVKVIPGVNTYVAVDGGMTDNPRYALYGALYQPILPARPEAEPTQRVIIAGRCCESGDIVTPADIPPVKAGDLLAIQATGAYNYSMASHYNRLPNPPIVMVRDGEHRLAVRRETYDDVMNNDL
ncbi:diaminopimelate decarboxylase [Clostridia bacterium]|nr:diaminopimelate decarboxylase [Clostridia bacterium]